jgi:hypothetical protein
MLKCIQKKFALKSMVVVRKLFFVFFVQFYILFGSCFLVMSQERKIGHFMPLAPEFLLKEEGFHEVKDRVVKRFSHPSAQLINLPASFGLKEYYSLDIFKPGETYENEIEYYKSRNERIRFIGSCGLRYVGSKYLIYLTTSLLPPLNNESVRYVADEKLRSRNSSGAYSVRKFTFEDGTESMLYNSDFMMGGKNQLVFIKDNKYYISMASNLDVEEMIKLIDNNLIIK